ncbi:MAG: hypothetical protein ACD_63C00126G0001 [uncultured bacterium]|nr:MAG: hypothetical protein ACD_63C00126G0001 [uncultured bacterium]
MSKTTKFLVLSLSVIVFFAFVGAGCGFFDWRKKAAEKSLEQALEKQSGGKVDIEVESNTTTWETEEGKSEFGTGEIPANFPSDLPLYPGATASYTFVGSGNEEGSASATLETSDSMDKVSSWYKQNIESNGWSITRTDQWGADSDQFSNYVAEKGDKELSVGITSPEGKTMITITINKKSDTNPEDSDSSL